MNATSKLVKAWESKNAKNAAKAGGISLMALSLAACGGSSTPVADAPAADPVAPAVTPVALTTKDGDVLIGTSGDDVFTGVVSGSASSNTYDSADSITDPNAADADVLTVSATDDVTTTATLTGIETVKFNLDALSASGTGNATDFNVALTNIAAKTTVDFDNVNSSSIVSGLVITGDAGGVRNVSNDFTTISSVLDADADATFNIAAKGAAAAPVTLTVTQAADELTVDAAGYLTVTAGAVTDLINVDAENDVTIADAGDVAALIVNSGGDVTISDANQATVVRVVSGGDIAITADKLDAALAPNLDAAGTVSVDLKAASVVTVAGSKTITISDDATADALKTVNTTVKTEATDLDLTGADAVSTINVFGDQDFTVEMSAADIDGLTDNKLTLVDNTTAGSATLELSTAVGDVDASSVDVDNIKMSVDNAAKTVTVASGQLVTIATDNANGGTVTFAGKAATAATNTITVNLDDGTDSATNTAADILGVLAFSSIDTAVINANLEQLSDGSKETHVIDALTGNGASVTVNMGANDLSVTGVVNLGATDTLTITGSGKVTGDGSEAITAKAIDASVVTGVVTLNEIESDQVASVTTGSANDVVETTAAGGGTEKDLTIKTNAGDDKLTLHAAGVAGESLTVDMGDGDDTIVFAASQAITRTGTDLNTISGVENLEYLGAFTVDSSVINKAAWVINDTANTAAAENLTVTVLASDTAIDLSGLTAKAVDAASVAADTFIVNASDAGLNGTTSITGASIAKNTLTANDLADTTLTGGDKADTLNGGDGDDIISGGAGIDTINGGSGTNTLTGGTGADIFITGNGTDTVTDFVVGASGDKVHLDLSGINAQSTMLLVEVGVTADQTDSDSVIATKIQGVYDIDDTGLTAGTNTFILHGATIANTDALETALEAGGDYELTAGAAYEANDGFLVTYSDGTNSYLATVEMTKAVSDGDTIVSGDLVATNVLEFTGISDVDTILASQFADIIA